MKKELCLLKTLNFSLSPSFGPQAKSSSLAAASTQSVTSHPSPPGVKPCPHATPPRPKPCPHLPPTTSEGRVDLDAPEFDEFNLSEEDMATLAAQFTDDRVKVGIGYLHLYLG